MSRAKRLGWVDNDEYKVTPFADYERKHGFSKENAKGHGLPLKITGNKFSCSCGTVFLESASTVVNGVIEARYRCELDAVSHIMFKVPEKKTIIRHDKFGKPMEETGFTSGELEEM